MAKIVTMFFACEEVAEDFKKFIGKKYCFHTETVSSKKFYSRLESDKFQIDDSRWNY